ncbi:MAG: hypothetical protein J6Q19_00860, partial [Bacteroidaceae bacterium]|nr:hypothetical protein [Bacteroidaceae bacterium]
MIFIFIQKIFIQKQIEFNKEHNIKPKGIQKAIPDLIQDFNDLVGAPNNKAVKDIEKDLPMSIEEIKKQMK